MVLATRNIVLGNVVKPLVLATFSKQCCQNHCFSTFPKTMLPNPSILHLFSNNVAEIICKKKKTVGNFDINIARTNGFSNIVLGNVVQPMVFATLFSKMM